MGSPPAWPAPTPPPPRCRRRRSRFLRRPRQKPRPRPPVPAMPCCPRRAGPSLPEPQPVHLPAWPESRAGLVVATDERGQRMAGPAVLIRVARVPRQRDAPRLRLPHLSVRRARALPAADPDSLSGRHRIFGSPPHRASGVARSTGAPRRLCPSLSHSKRTETSVRRRRIRPARASVGVAHARALAGNKQSQKKPSETSVRSAEAGTGRPSANGNRPRERADGVTSTDAACLAPNRLRALHDAFAVLLAGHRPDRPPSIGPWRWCEMS